MSKTKHSEKLIEQTNKLLSQNYGFTFVGGSFYAIEFDDETKRLNKKSFIGHAKMLIGDEAQDLISDWFDSKRAEITKKLLDYLDNIDREESGSIKLSFQMLQYFEKDSLITDEAVIAFFESYYELNFLENVVNKLIEKFEPKDFDDIEFKRIKEELQRTETEKIYTLAKNKLNDWYSKSILGDKLADLFSQFVITLGKIDWKVTWVGHGPVTTEKILKHFRLDTDSHDEFILKQYQEWYENEIIEASSREMNNPNNFKLYNQIQEGKLKLNRNALDDLDI